MIDLDDTVLRGVALAVKAADRDLRRDLNRAAGVKLRPMWRQQIAMRARTRQDRAVYGTGSASGGNPPVLTAATSRRARSGGLTPTGDWPLVEFGSGRAHGLRGQLPRRYPKGRVAYAAKAAVASAAAHVWAGVVYDAYRGALDADPGR